MTIITEMVPVKRNRTVASDKTCEKLITRKVLCFPVLELDALDPSLDTRSFQVLRIEDRVVKFEFQGTVNSHLHYCNSG